MPQTDPEPIRRSLYFDDFHVGQRFFTNQKNEIVQTGTTTILLAKKEKTA